ncbi:MAG: PepSY domain-containing protein [Nitrospira sp.]|nr:PepSY domain-containing protein [Nitrospira sp.]
MKSLTLVLTLAVGTVLALGTPAWSEKKKCEDGDIAALAKEATVTIEQAVKTAVEKVPGTVVEAELEKKHGKPTWEVDVLGADGMVTEVCIDAVTGAVLGTEAKDKQDEKKKEGKKGK